MTYLIEQLAKGVRRVKTFGQRHWKNLLNQCSLRKGDTRSPHSLRQTHFSQDEEEQLSPIVTKHASAGPTVGAATSTEENGETKQSDNNDFNLYVPINVLIIILFLLVE